MNHDVFQTVPWSSLALPEASLSARSAANLSSAALLGFRLAIEDDFIWHSNREHDLWSGSGLLSWLMAHILHSLIERLGTDYLVFPAAGEWPGTEDLKREFLRHDWSPSPLSDSVGTSQNAAGEIRVSDRRTLGLPSHFLAVVPVGFELQPLLGVALAEWKRIARSCWLWLADRYPMDTTKPVLWESQTKRALRFVWQLWPWQGPDRAAELLRKIDAPNSLAHPRTEAAWLWQANLALLSHRFVARQQTLDFPAWEGQAGADHDPVNPLSEAIIAPARLAENRKNPPETLTHPDLSLVFQPQERLSALSVIKRVWLRAVLGANNFPLTTALARSSPADPQNRITGCKHPVSRPLALLVWTGSIAQMDFTAQWAPRQIALHHGRLLRSVQDQGVACVPITEALACAQTLHQDFCRASLTAIDMGVAIPVGAVSFARLVQTARETIGKESADRQTPEGQHLPSLVVRLVEASHSLAEWSTTFGSPALVRLSKLGASRSDAPAINEDAARGGYIKQILCRLDQYPLQQVINPGLAAIILADLERIYEPTEAAQDLRSGCREYLSSATENPPQCLSEFWNWLVLSRFFAAAKARIDNKEFAE